MFYLRTLFAQDDLLQNAVDAQNQNVWNFKIIKKRFKLNFEK